MTLTLALVIIVVIVALCFDFVNGFNDAANAIAAHTAAWVYWPPFSRTPGR